MNELEARINNVCLIIITAAVITVALNYTRTALIPFVFSIFLYSTLTPVVNWIQAKGKVPRLAAMTVALGLLILILSTMVIFIVISIDNFIAGANKYEQVINDIIYQTQAYADQFGYEINLQIVQDSLKNLPLLGMAKSVTGQLVKIISTVILIFIFTLFLLAGEKPIHRADSQFISEILNKISLYVSAKFLLSLATGFLVWLVLIVFNVEMALIFALLTVLLNFIPTIGSIIAVALPLPMLILQFQFGWPLWMVLALTGSIQLTIGNIVEPKIMGESMDLHPITVLMSLIFWGLVWGIAGMFLAVPITAILKIIFSRLPATQGFSEVLAGRLPARN